MRKRWVHVIVNAHGTWLHGDPRGFRSRDNELHSNGDYKYPPPAGEHAGLHRYRQAQSQPPTRFPPDLRPTLLQAFVTKTLAIDHRIIVASCGDSHLHSILELPLSYDAAKKEIGKAKQAASHAVRDRLTGTIWAAGGKVKRISDLSHFRAAYQYLRSKQEPGTVVWSHRPDEDWIHDPSIAVVVMGKR